MHHGAPLGFEGSAERCEELLEGLLESCYEEPRGGGRSHIEFSDEELLGGYFILTTPRSRWGDAIIY